MSPSPADTSPLAFARTTLSAFFERGPDPLRDPRLQHVLEQLPAAVLLTAPLTGAILAVNGEAAALTEWTRNELLSRPLTDILAGPSVGETLAVLRALEPGNSRSILDVSLRARSGRSVMVDLKLSALEDVNRDEKLVLLQAVPADVRLAQERETALSLRVGEISHRLLALLSTPTEEAIPQAVRLAREMLNADAAGLYYIITNPPGLTLKYLDTTTVAHFPKTLGPSEAQFLTTPLSWNNSQRPEALLCQSARSGGWAHLIASPIGDPPAIIGALFVAYRPSNPPSAHAVNRLVMATRQIHYLIEQIARDAKLADAQQLAIRLSSQMAAINAQIDEGIVLLSGKGTLDEINRSAARMLGYRSEDVTGLPYADVLVADDQLAQAITQCLQYGAVSTLEGKLHRRGGDAFPVMLRVQPLPEGGHVISIRDLSSERANEVRREYLDNLAYVGQSTQAFAHEVRAPLNNIAIGVQYLAARLNADEAMQTAIQKIQAECNRLSSLMNDMLSWAKPVDPKLEATDLAALLKRLLSRWSNKIQQRNVRLNFVLEDGCSPVLADARLLERVFVNLLDNALQAMPAGGDLMVRLKTVRRESEGQVVEAQVGDSGPGISEENRRHIFDPYFTTKTDGTGLGLAICKRLVTVHHGAINVESYPDAGTIFTVTIPAYSPLPTAPEPIA